ncbi:hypothetical protein KA005_48890 [bacterium]|nr:hypothetical protein [bacterium]
MNIDWSKDEEARIPYAINFLKAVLPTFDELLEFMESHKYWLPLQDNVINNFLTYNLNWWDFYEDENRFRALCAIAFIDEDELKEIPENYTLEEFISEATEVMEDVNTSEDLTDENIDEAKRVIESSPEDEQIEYAKQSILMLTSFLASTFQYLALMTHGRSMCQLVEDAKKGDDNAFCIAVQVDRNVLRIPYFQERLFRAQLSADTKFLTTLGYRMKNPIIKGKIRYRTLYLAFALLDDLGMLGLPHNTLLDICDEIGVYGRDHGIEDVGHLRKRLHEYRKFQRNSKNL